MSARLRAGEPPARRSIRYRFILFLLLLKEGLCLTRSCIAQTGLTNSTAAGVALGQAIRDAFAGIVPDVVIVFAAASYDHPALLTALKATCQPRIIVGCSSAGEFTNRDHGADKACVLGLHATEMAFQAVLARDFHHHIVESSQSIATAFKHPHSEDYTYRYALLLTDVLAGNGDALIEQLTLATSGTYQFFGGGAGDNAQFAYTPVFCDTQSYTDAVVALEILSNKPLGLGIGHGWVPNSAPYRVTASDGLRLSSLNAMSTLEALREHAETTGQTLEEHNPMPFFLHNVIGIDTGNGYKLRVPLALQPDGAVTCAAEVPLGSTIYFMRTSHATAAEAAALAAKAALQRLNGLRPQAALFFDCVATRLRMDKEFGMELAAIEQELHTPIVGCNTHGQIARTEGQFNGFHNCTAVVCLIPE